MKQYFLCIACLILVSCVGDSTDSGGATEGSSNGQSAETNNDQSTEIDDGIECKKVTNERDLDKEPVYSFEGLWSNWQNGEDLAGFSDTVKFNDTFANLTAVAFERDDQQLKRTLVESLHEWTSKDAFLGTKVCYVPGANCTGWQDPEGFDVSDAQTYNFVLFHVEALRMNYSYLSDWAMHATPEKHGRIREWFQYWESIEPEPPEPYYGLAIHWKIQQLMDAGDIESARDYTRRLLEGIDTRINDDGSIKERTTRGDRALWYHFTTLNEIMGAIRLHKELGLGDIDFSIKVHSAVNLFLRTLEDPSYILPWASVSLDNGGDGTAQQFTNSIPNDFSDWYHTSSNGTWIYIYINEYPSHANAAKIREIVPLQNAASAYQDNQYFPLGCMLY